MPFSPGNFNGFIQHMVRKWAKEPASCTKSNIAARTYSSFLAERQRWFARLSEGTKRRRFRSNPENDLQITEIKYWMSTGQSQKKRTASRPASEAMPLGAVPFRICPVKGGGGDSENGSIS